MTAALETHRVIQYSTNIQLLLQQKGSRFRGKVMEQPCVGKQVSPVDQYGAVDAQQRTTRYPALTPNEVPSDRRWVYPVDFDWNTLVDSIDKLRNITDPEGAITMAAVNGMARKIDDRVIAAFTADAKTGEQGGTTTSFLAGNQISASEGANSATGMNVAKLKKAMELALTHEWDIESDPIFCAIGPKQHTNLLNEAQVIDSDFFAEMGRPVLEKGWITRWGPFQFVMTNRLATNVSSQRRCPVWVKSGMCLGVWDDISTDISQRKDLAGLPWQVYVKGTFDATRLEEKKVIEIPCAE